MLSPYSCMIFRDSQSCDWKTCLWSAVSICWNQNLKRMRATEATWLTLVLCIYTRIIYIHWDIMDKINTCADEICARLKEKVSEKSRKSPYYRSSRWCPFASMRMYSDINVRLNYHSGCGSHDNVLPQLSWRSPTFPWHLPAISGQEWFHSDSVRAARHLHANRM